MLEVDRIQITETIKLHHQAIPNLNFPMQEEKRQTKQYIPSGIRGRHRTNRNWKKLEKRVEDRISWRMLVGGLRSTTKGNKRKQVNK